MADKRQRAVWCLMGATATGKTGLAVELCRRFPFEIVSVDSSLVYRGMDIGTAKPDAETLFRCPHHLVDIRNPRETYSAADFCRDARSVIDDIFGRGRWPLLVGGTMFYFRALEKGLPELPAADPAVRRTLEERAARCGWTALYRELERLDPARAARIEPGDRQRIQRALEIALLAGASPAGGGAVGLGEQYRLCKLALAPSDRRWLHRRIESRFTAMARDGIVEEVRNLMKNRTITADLPAVRMVGYRQVIQYLAGDLEYNDMVRRAGAATRQLAKRQLTWLRNQPGVTWLDCSSLQLEETAVDYIRAKKAAFG